VRFAFEWIRKGEHVIIVLWWVIDWV